jgi:hypothetical protein
MVSEIYPYFDKVVAKMPFFAKGRLRPNVSAILAGKC